ncbi:aldo/keto reductase [Actinospica sp. MGRD01-02]|uniref:Aldo/keto reductase n=1 Tax=Actinospica acidithermotolerans TaxID=2828514 RepID=A0A941ILR3_9ACTN|nr:aldo/keto reductase [Actinospica acidithermotolerans]MBR7829318.1 aldo/keto reductase [Actinospica acidithermotolerans]
MIEVVVTTSVSSLSSSPGSSNAADSGAWRIGERDVRRLGFGAMRLTGTAAFHGGSPRERGTSIAVVRRAVELGVNHIDTAAFYFSSLRSANEIINAALAPFGDEVLVATKVGPRRDSSGGWAEAARPEQLRGDVEENLRQLGRDHLDLVYLRNMRFESIAEHFGALAELQEAGLIRQLGLSGVTPEQLAQAQAIAPVAAVQNRFGLAHREAAEVLRACGQAGIAFVPFFAIAGSRASGAAPKPTVAQEDSEMLAIARAHGATPAQIRLAWTLAQGPHVLAIPGTGDLAHLEANVAAGGIRLTQEDLAVLEAAI